jgi:hypothetical protein
VVRVLFLAAFMAVIAWSRSLAFARAASQPGAMATAPIVSPWSVVALTAGGGPGRGMKPDRCAILRAAMLEALEGAMNVAGITGASPHFS